MDWRKKYLDCFFMWQELYDRAAKHIEKLEKRIKELERQLNDR